MSDLRPNSASPPEILHAPWRFSYMKMLSAAANKQANKGKAESSQPSPCFLRDYFLHPELDESNHVVVRTGNATINAGGMILLNGYPYANGHLLVCLGIGRQRLMDYTDQERAELWSLVDLAVDLCERTLPVQGVNVGVNQGLAAGAGVPEHLHVHVVPRWQGDVNFTTAVANIRVLPSSLEDMAARYREVWSNRRTELGL
ncbi:MAG: HIT domain-containing protein [Planctomycetota bacterium]